MADDALPEAGGDPSRIARLTVRAWDRLVAAVRRNTILDNLGGGLDIRRGPEGTTLTVVVDAPAGQAVRKAKAPSGGIGPKVGNTPGSATCTFYTWDGVSELLGTETAVVKNSYPTSPGVGANKDIWVVQRWRDDGSAWDYFLLNEAC